MSFWTEVGAPDVRLRCRFVVTAVTPEGEKLGVLFNLISVSPFSYGVGERLPKSGTLHLKCLSIESFEKVGFLHKMYATGGLFNLRISLVDKQGDENGRYVARTCTVSKIVVDNLGYDDGDDPLTETVHISHFGIKKEDVLTKTSREEHNEHGSSAITPPD